MDKRTPQQHRLRRLMLEFREQRQGAQMDPAERAELEAYRAKRQPQARKGAK